MQFEIPVIECRLLIDQNLSFGLRHKLSSLFREIDHVKTLAMLDADDFKIWNFARDNSYIILTQDSDFNDINELKGWPPQIIWLRCGNRSTGEFLEVIRKSISAIQAFVADDSAGLLEIYK